MAAFRQFFSLFWRALGVCCVCAAASTGCVSSGNLAPTPLTGDYSEFLVDLMAASAQHTARGVRTERAAAAVAAWRTEQASEAAGAGGSDAMSSAGSGSN